MADVDMQAAFEQFMLGKSKSAASPSPQKESQKGNSHYNNKRKKGHRPVLKAFQGRLEEWKDTNGQLEAVLKSIFNLRDRVFWESNSLKESEANETESLLHSWKDYGFRSGRRNTALEKEDIHLALNHDLLQHERMLSALRSLLASLAQTVDDIGRRLDEWMLQNLMEEDTAVYDERTLGSQIKEQTALELAQQVCSLVASDLYRKQKMASEVFDSCHDGVLLKCDFDYSSNDYVWMPDPRHVVNSASKDYPSPDSGDPTWSAVRKILEIA